MVTGDKLQMPREPVSPLVPLKSVASSILYTYYLYRMRYCGPPWTNRPGRTEPVSAKVSARSVDGMSRTALR